MPSVFIPAHMSHLEMSGGLPVPMIVAASRHGHAELRESTWPVADLMTVWVVDKEGPPDFGKYDEANTRKCVAGRYCHVCGTRSPDLLICSPSGAKLTPMGDAGSTATAFALAGSRWLVSAPWVCAPCLAFACMTCPPLRRAIGDGRGVVYAGRLDAPIVVTYYQPVDPGDPVPPPGKTVVSSFKIDIGDPKVGTQPLVDWCKRSVPKFARKWGMSI